MFPDVSTDNNEMFNIFLITRVYSSTFSSVIYGQRDLSNPHGQTQTTNFITSMLCMGLYPSIKLPSRITTNSATLIHNIFTNVTEGKWNGGLILTDTSGHLSVFVTLQSNNKNPKDTESEGLETKHFRRPWTESAIDSLREDLINQDWSNIYADDVDESYDKHCPLVANLDKNKYKDKLWLTKGIQNAWKKKNSLYRVFPKLRTQEAEEEYKTYINKLTRLWDTEKRIPQQAAG